MSGIQSLSRGLLILDSVATAERSVSITEVAQMLQIDKSSASRLVKTLVQHEYLQPERGSRRFVLGKRMYQISWQLLNRMPVREKAKPYLYRLVQETGECSHTAVYSEGKALMIDDIEAEETTLRVVGGIGRRLPLHCTAVGKSLLAFSHLPLPAVLEAKTPRTITQTNALKAHLADVRAAGYALDDEEHEPGVRCMAAPVYDAMGSVIASIGISGPTVRVTDDRIDGLAQHIMQAAAALSAELGYVALPEAQVGD